jgi:hypothetical protein
MSRQYTGGNIYFAVPLLASVLAYAGAPGHAATGNAQPDPAGIADTIKDWPKAAQAAAQDMLKAYGPPAEATATMLIWQNNGPWVRSVVHKSPVDHDFPIKHQDVLEQVVEYRVPLNFFEPIATFDGSVIPNRTRGELTASGDREAANILALNLADDIVQGRKTADQARSAMVTAAREIAAGHTPEDAGKLHIPKPQGDLRDPDTAIIDTPPSPAR